MKRKLLYILAACVFLMLCLSPVMAQQHYNYESVDGKYSNLLMKLYVPEDYDRYGDFYDYGYWSGTSYAGHENVPVGYWVYVYPYWYIWENKN